MDTKPLQSNLLQSNLLPTNLKGLGKAKKAKPPASARKSKKAARTSARR
jgi:hypothetical protein